MMSVEEVVLLVRGRVASYDPNPSRALNELRYVRGPLFAKTHTVRALPSE